MSAVVVSDENDVRTLTIARPERRNALSVGVALELTEAIEEAESDGIGALLLAGAGGHFSAGGDVESILEAVFGDSDDAPLRLMKTFHRLVEAIWDSPLPVVAAVSGVVYGGAFNLVLACDLIYSSKDARFCQVFMRRGVAPDLGGAYLLPRLIGMQRAKELMLLADEIDAIRAKELGVVNAVFEDPGAALSQARLVAERLAAAPRLTMAMTKGLINSSTGGTLATSLAAEAVTQAVLLRSAAAREGFGGFGNSKRERR